MIYTGLDLNLLNQSLTFDVNTALGRRDNRYIIETQCDEKCQLFTQAVILVLKRLFHKTSNIQH